MVALSFGDPNKNSWFLDSGAMHHITADSFNLASKNDYNGKEKLCLFLGYNPTHKGYRCLSSSVGFIAKSITFNENDFPYSTLFTQPNTPHQSFIHKFNCPSYVLPYCPPVSPPSTHLPTSSSQRHIYSFSNMSNTFTTHIDTPMALTLPISNALSTMFPIVDNIVSIPCTHVVQPITTTMSQLLLYTSTNIHSMQTKSKRGIYKPKVYTTVVALPDHFQEPSSIRQALQLPHWKMTMEAEYSALVHNGTWRLVPKTEGIHIVQNK
ncbi:hypothetical protein AAG906_022653 [Vitis piasezkii]